MGVEPTTKQILSLPPLPIGLQEQILVLLVGIEPTTIPFLRRQPLPVGLQEQSLAAPPGLEPGIFAFKGRYVANYTTGLYCQGRV